MPTLIEGFPNCRKSDSLRAESVAGSWQQIGRLIEITCFDHPGTEPRGLAARTQNGALVGRLLAMALVLMLEDHSREAAARRNGMDRQTQISRMQAAKQAPIGPHTVRQDISGAPIVLRAGNTEPIAQPVELLGVDRVHHEVAINQGVAQLSPNRSAAFLRRGLKPAIPCPHNRFSRRFSTAIRSLAAPAGPPECSPGA
jgi:hypothetical protein